MITLAKTYKIPTLKDLENTYQILNSKAAIADSDLVKYAHWSRFDPRLGEILVGYIEKNWMKHNPISIRKENLKSQFPQALPVMLEHAKPQLTGNQGIKKHLEDQNIFKHFQAIIEEGLLPAPYQSFSIGIYNPGGKLLRQKALNPHPFFKKWGFYETDPFYNKDGGKNIGTHINPATRKNILRALLADKKTITVNDYLEACHFAVDRRQAERDLNTFYKLKKFGNTRSRTYSR
ncbi:MAG: hypothetical protein KDD38_04070 [Bdellovibrionales bacterium]|nr:hypothetical protein [Bdellovibrionales bacterium]